MQGEELVLQLRHVHGAQSSVVGLDLHPQTVRNAEITSVRLNESNVHVVDGAALTLRLLTHNIESGAHCVDEMPNVVMQPLLHQICAVTAWK